MKGERPFRCGQQRNGLIAVSNNRPAYFKKMVDVPADAW